MRIKKIKSRITLLSIASAAITLPIIATVSCGVKSLDPMAFWIGSRRDLQETVNAKNTFYTEKFSTDTSLSNISTMPSAYAAQGKLISTYVKKEVEVNPTYFDTEADFKASKQKFGKLKNPAQIPKVYYKLQLAEHLNIYDGVKWHIFNSDAVPDTSKNEKWTDPKFNQSINGPKFKSLIATGRTPKIQKVTFKLREAYWVNSKGEKTKYKLVNKDFVTGRRRNYFWTLTKKTLQTDGGRYAKDIENIAKWLNRYAGQDINVKQNSDNTYLLLLLNMDPKKFYGIGDDISNSEKVFNDYNLLKDMQGNNSDDYLTYEFRKNTNNPNVKMLLDKFIAGEIQFTTPVPTEYIKSLANNVKTYENAAGTDKVTLLPKDATLSQIGLFNYAYNSDEQLFVGHYYISKNTNFEFKVVKNTHYADKQWANDKTNVRSLTTNYRILDKSLQPKIQYANFKGGSQYYVANNFLSDGLTISDLKELYEYNKKHNGSIVKYGYELNSKSSQHSLAWSSSPVWGAKYTPTLNDDMARMLWGRTIEEIRAGKSTTTGFMTSGLVFRNNLAALINWYTVAQDSRSNPIIWPFWAAPGSKYSDDSTEMERIYRKDGSVDMNWPFYSWDGTNLEKAGAVSYEENKERYEKGGASGLNLYQNASFEAIKAAFEKTFSAVFAGRIGEINLQFVYPIRSTWNSAKYNYTYKKIADMLEGITFNINSNKAQVKFKIKELGKATRENNSPDFRGGIVPYLINGGITTWAGWTSDTDDVAGYIIAQVYPIAYKSRALLLATSLLADKAPENTLGAELAKRFPSVARFAKKLNDRMKIKLQELINDINTRPNHYFKSTIKASTKEKILKKIREFKFTQIYKLAIASSKGRKELFEFNIPKAEQKTTFQDAVNSEFNEHISNPIKLAYLEIGKGTAASGNDKAFAVKLIKELEILAGPPLTFFDPGFVLSDPKVPTHFIKKPWIEILTSSRGRVSHIWEWKIKEEK